MNRTSFKIRPIDLARDAEVLQALDASFTTDLIYRLNISNLSAEFVEVKLPEPLTKRYDVSEIKIAIDESELALAAEIAGTISAFMTVKHEVWNRRSWITHLYVAPEHRGRGIGRMLIDEAVAHAKKRGARGLWLETQIVNYPAIKFYRRLGFRFCGFDASFYDPALMPGETAFYFCLPFGD